jgi:hypothetical protein
VVVLVLHAPALVAIATLHLLQDTTSTPSAAIGLAAVAVLAITFFLCGPLVAAALTEHTILGLGGDRAPFGRAVRNALGAALRVLPLAFAVSLLELLGYGLLIVPGIVASVLLALAVPIQVVERVSLGTAIARSVKLTKGARWALFAALMTAGTVGFLTARLVSVFLGEIGTAFGFVLQTTLSSAMAAVVYADRRAAHEGVEIATLVAQLGGVPGGAARALDDAVERALANVGSATMPPTAFTAPPPRSVKDEELMDAATARDRRMKRVKIGVAAFGVAGVVALAALGVHERAEAKREEAAAAASLAADLAHTRVGDAELSKAILSRVDIYGKSAGPLAVALNEKSAKDRATLVFNQLEDELVALGCGEALAAARRSQTGAFGRGGGRGGGGADFARDCPASPLVETEAAAVDPVGLVTATALEARAAKSNKGNDPIHRAIVAALLKS